MLTCPLRAPNTKLEWMPPVLCCSSFQMLLILSRVFALFGKFVFFFTEDEHIRKLVSRSLTLCSDKTHRRFSRRLEGEERRLQFHTHPEYRRA